MASIAQSKTTTSSTNKANASATQSATKSKQGKNGSSDKNKANRGIVDIAEQITVLMDATTSLNARIASAVVDSTKLRVKLKVVGGLLLSNFVYITKDLSKLYERIAQTLQESKIEFENDIITTKIKNVVSGINAMTETMTAVLEASRTSFVKSFIAFKMFKRRLRQFFFFVHDVNQMMMLHLVGNFDAVTMGIRVKFVSMLAQFVNDITNAIDSIKMSPIGLSKMYWKLQYIKIKYAMRFMFSVIDLINNPRNMVGARLRFFYKRLGRTMKRTLFLRVVMASITATMIKIAGLVALLALAFLIVNPVVLGVALLSMLAMFTFIWLASKMIGLVRRLKLKDIIIGGLVATLVVGVTMLITIAIIAFSKIVNQIEWGGVFLGIAGVIGFILAGGIVMTIIGFILGPATGYMGLAAIAIGMIVVVAIGWIMHYVAQVCFDIQSMAFDSKKLYDNIGTIVGSMGYFGMKLFENIIYFVGGLVALPFVMSIATSMLALGGVMRMFQRLDINATKVNDASHTCVDSMVYFVDKLPSLKTLIKAQLKMPSLIAIAIAMRSLARGVMAIGQLSEGVDYARCGESVANVLSTLMVPMMHMANGELLENGSWVQKDGLKAVFTDGLFASSSPIGRVIEASSRLGEMMANLATGVTAMASSTFKDASGKVVQLTKDDYQRAGENAALVITTIMYGTDGKSGLIQLANDPNFQQASKKSFWDFGEDNSSPLYQVLATSTRVASFMADVAKSVAQFATGSFTGSDGQAVQLTDADFAKAGHNAKHIIKALIGSEDHGLLSLYKDDDVKKMAKDNAFLDGLIKTSSVISSFAQSLNGLTNAKAVSFAGVAKHLGVFGENLNKIDVMKLNQARLIFEAIAKVTTDTNAQLDKFTETLKTDLIDVLERLEQVMTKIGDTLPDATTTTNEQSSNATSTSNANNSNANETNNNANNESNDNASNNVSNELKQIRDLLSQMHNEGIAITQRDKFDALVVRMN